MSATATNIFTATGRRKTATARVRLLEGSGKLLVTSATKISLNNVNCSMNQIKLGDWAEARYNWTTKEATKLSVTRL